MAPNEQETSESIRKTLEPYRNEDKEGNVDTVVIVLLSDQDSTLHGMAKTIGDLDVGVHTVCHVCRQNDGY
jgi:hypothetical protein